MITSIHQDAFSKLTALEELTLEQNQLSKLTRGDFRGLHSLTHLYLGHNSIEEIQKNTFSELKSLSQLKLNNNRLRKIAHGAFDNTKLVQLQLDDNKLEELPVFNKPSFITNLEISYNHIKTLDAETLKKYGELEVLHLIKAQIKELPEMVFINNTKLRRLSLQDSELEEIHPKAFEGTELKTLDLAKTKISYLPGENLEGLEYFFIKGVKTLWEIPIVSFKSLRRATVEYPFHCCLINAQWSDTPVGTPPPLPQRTGPTAKMCPKSAGVIATTNSPPLTTKADPFDLKLPKETNGSDIVITLPPDECVDPDKEVVVTHPPFSSRKKVNCTPKEDAFNPCGNLLGSNALRVCTWFVLVFALVGNSFKLFVLLLSKRKISIAKILMCNLAFANFCMGVFLCMLASADLYSLGKYQNFAIRWQYRTGCKVAGFVSIFSTELAVFVLTVITVERYFTIVHPFKLDKHLNTKQIIVLMVLGWVFSLTMATLPLFPNGVSSYQKVAICLPFELESTVSKVYVTFLLATNGLAFFFVLFCYGRMYCSLGGSGSGHSVNRVESRVAKRMAMLVITNFACWFPIALVSLIAIYGTTLINVPAAQFFLVFVYPINSFTNPYLYAIGTKHFQLDALEILGRLGICSSAIKNLSNRLRDQLETTLPNSSRGYTGSKISLSSVRSPNQTPIVSPRETCSFKSHRGDSWKSYNGSVHSNNNSHRTASSRNSPSCSPCSFLSIPSIHRKNYDLKQQREESDSRTSLSLQNSSTRNSIRSSDQIDKCLARRLSAREVVLEGSIFSRNRKRSRGGTVNDSDEIVPLEPENADSTEEENREQESNPILRVPTVMVTSC